MIQGSVSSLRNLMSSGKFLVKECQQVFQAGGLKGIFQRYGWKIFAVFFVYYLIRDSILYLLLPFLLARHFL